MIMIAIAGREAGNSTILNLVSKLGQSRYSFDGEGVKVSEQCSFTEHDADVVVVVVYLYY